MIMIPVLLVCCSSLLIASLTPLACGENLTHRWTEIKATESWAVLDTRLPYYTAGFE